MRKEYQKEYQRKRYLKNPQERKDRVAKHLKELKKWFQDEIISKSKCIECGENHPAVLDFHHRDPEQKEFAVTKMIVNKCSKERILNEIAKCDVLCSNCHRKLHWEERIGDV